MVSEDGIVELVPCRKIIPAGDSYYELEFISIDEIRMSPIIAWAIDEDTLDITPLTFDEANDPNSPTRAILSPNGSVIDVAGFRYRTISAWREAAIERQGKQPEVSNLIRPTFPK